MSGRADIYVKVSCLMNPPLDDRRASERARRRAPPILQLIMEMLERRGMDFEYTDDQKELRRALREFAEKEIVPYAAEWDEKERFRADVIRKLGELGFLGVIFPERYGGAGMRYADYAIVIAELARAAASGGIT